MFKQLSHPGTLLAEYLYKIKRDTNSAQDILEMVLYDETTNNLRVQMLTPSHIISSGPWGRLHKHLEHLFHHLQKNVKH